MVSPPPRSLLRRTFGYTALGLAVTLLLRPPGAGARVAAPGDTPPVVSYTVDGIAGSNGWYRGSTSGQFIVVRWTVSQPVISTSGCEPAVRIDDPNAGTTLTCTATRDGGTTSVTTKTLKVDATACGLSAAAARGPDHNGWYNHSVSIQWSGTDATSGIDSCTSSTYSGPDRSNASTAGTCTDKAGNVSRTPLSFGLSYDDTGPTGVSVSPARGSDHAGWYTRPVVLQ